MYYNILIIIILDKYLYVNFILKTFCVSNQNIYCFKLSKIVPETSYKRP